MDSLKLIDMIKSYPELYDRKHRNYTNMDIKKDIWVTISSEFNESEESVRARWRNIRDAYQKSIRKKHELSDTGKLSTYKKYKYEDLLDFLYPFCSTQKRRRLAGNDSKSEKPIKITKVFLKSENDDIIGEVYTDDNDYDNIERLDEQEQDMEQSSINYEDSNYKLIETVGSDIQDEETEIHYESSEQFLIPTDTEENKTENKQRQHQPSQHQQSQQEYYIPEAVKPRDITINFFLNMAV